MVSDVPDPSEVFVTVWCSRRVTGPACTRQDQVMAALSTASTSKRTVTPTGPMTRPVSPGRRLVDAVFTGVARVAHVVTLGVELDAADLW